jgi:hypothetical protein
MWSMSSCCSTRDRLLQACLRIVKFSAICDRRITRMCFLKVQNKKRMLQRPVIAQASKLVTKHVNERLAANTSPSSFWTEWFVRKSQLSSESTTSSDRACRMLPINQACRLRRYSRARRDAKPKSLFDNELCCSCNKIVLSSSPQLLPYRTATSS